MNKQNLHTYIKENEANICQIVANFKGKEIYADQWNDYKKYDCAHIMSATKSIIALLFGIAIDLGKINSVEDKVLSYFPDYDTKRGEKTIFDVKVWHLLAMQAPYKCKGDPWTKVCGSKDWTKTSLDLLGGRKGITNQFNYQTVCLHILSGILYKATGMKTVDFANKYLFVPLGIHKHNNYFAKTAEEHKKFTISKTPKKSIWFADPDGLGTPGYGLCMSATDMVKIGQLCLNHGKYYNKQIVSSEWLDDMTSIKSITDEKFQNMNYGYLWWIIDAKQRIYAAIGNSGNVIYVDEKNHFTVGISSYFKHTVYDRIEFIENYLKRELLN